MYSAASRPSVGAGVVGLAEHLAGGEMGDAQPLVLQPLGLRPFSSAGRTKEHDAHGESVEVRSRRCRMPDIGD